MKLLCVSSFIQYHQPSVLLVAAMSMRVSWKYCGMDNGEQFVMIFLVVLMQVWCADNLATLLLMLLLLAMDTLDKAMAPSGWMMYNVMDMKTPCSNVQLLHLVIIIVLILKMLVFDVEVDILYKLYN